MKHTPAIWYVVGDGKLYAIHARVVEDERQREVTVARGMHREDADYICWAVNNAACLPHPVSP